MKILIAGNKGMLAGDIAETFRTSGHEVSGYDLPELDITDKYSAYEKVAAEKPDVVINCAAYTAVDKAESEPDKAFLVNATGAGNLAESAYKLRIPLIHFSTDYIFDGLKKEPYIESDAPNPLNVYGMSKLSGERAVSDANPLHIIVRASWLYGVSGKNFVKTIIRLANEKETLEVVDDQFGSPTWTGDLADTVLNICLRVIEGKEKKFWGVYNFCNSGYCSWVEFAEKIVEKAGKYENFFVKDIIPVSSEKYGSPVKRPRWSVLDCTKITETFGVGMNKWDDALCEMLKIYYHR